MISEFVAGSAWICPPVDGLAMDATGAVAWLAVVARATVDAPLTEAPPAEALDPSPAMAARKVYRTTLTELQALDNRDLADLGISRSMIRSIAHEAAYGK